MLSAAENFCMEVHGLFGFSPAIFGPAAGGGGLANGCANSEIELVRTAWKSMRHLHGLTLQGPHAARSGYFQWLNFEAASDARQDPRTP